MGQKTAGIVLGLSILGVGGTALAGEPGRVEPKLLRVFVVNQAHARPEVLRAAEDDVVTMFNRTGVRLGWLDEAAAVNQPFDVTIKITTGMTPAMLPNTAVGDLSLGFAAVNATGQGLRGRIAYVFFDQVETHAGDHHIDVSRLCGLVMAHEIGHLLLPAGHSDQGLMRGTWDLRSGLLEFFSKAEANAIRRNLAYMREHVSAVDEI
jgi:hypothetical protein